MAIKLRVNQPTALTYKEMDRNFSSFFYSASVDTVSNKLYLWYTGSSDLNGPGESYDPSNRYTEIELQPTEGENPTLTVAGTENGHIQIKSGNVLGFNNEFIYNSAGVFGIGINPPSLASKVHIKGNNTLPAIIRLDSTATGNDRRRSSIHFYQGGNTLMGVIGRDNFDNNNLYIKTYAGNLGGERSTAPGNLIFEIGGDNASGAWTPVGLGIGTLGPSRALHVEGQGYFKDQVSIGTGTITEKLLVNGNIGTELHAGKIGFGVWDSYDVGSSVGAYAHYGLSKVAGATPVNLSGYFGLTFATTGDERMRIADNGYVGINTETPAERLTVRGNISGSGNIKVNGNANIGTSLTTGTSATVGTTLTVTSTATILDVPLNADSNPRILVQSQTSGQVGQVQYITGVVPKGAIMMWNGSTAPSGWAICNGNNGAPIGNVVIPDLRERFIVGAGVESNKLVTVYDTQFTLPLPTLSYAGVTAGTYTFTVDTNTPYYLDTAGKLQSGVNIDGFRYHLYKGTNASQSSVGFLYIVYDNRYGAYEVIRGALPAVNSAATGHVAFAGTNKGGTTFYTTSPSFPLNNDTSIKYDKYFTNGRRVAFTEINWPTVQSTGYTPGDKGGLDNVILEGSQMTKHQHDTVGGETGGSGATYGHVGPSNNAGFYDGNNVHNLSSGYGNNQPIENRPPYYALAFIIYTGVI